MPSDVDDARRPRTFRARSVRARGPALQNSAGMIAVLPESRTRTFWRTPHALYVGRAREVLQSRVRTVESLCTHLGVAEREDLSAP